MIDQEALRRARIARRAHDDRMLQLTPAELNLKGKKKRRATDKRRRRAQAQKPMSRPKMGPKAQGRVASRKRAAARSRFA